MTIRDKILSIETELNSEIIGRKAEIRSLIRCILAYQHIMLIGPPGSAKSMLMHRFLYRLSCEMHEKFTAIFNPFTTQEEVIGTVDLDSMKAGRFRRNMHGYLPTAHYALLDEIWKSSGPTASVTLPMLNERYVKNGEETVQVPLKSAICCSNELPDDVSFEAAVERIAVRHYIEPPKATGNASQVEAILSGELLDKVTTITLEEIEEAHEEIINMPVSAEFNDFLVHELMPALEKMDIGTNVTSLRRMKQGIDVAKADAWLCGEDQVERHHGNVYADICWNDYLEQRLEVRKLVMELAGVNTQTLDGVDFDTEVKSIITNYQEQVDAIVESSDSAETKCSRISNKQALVRSKLSEHRSDWVLRWRNDPEFTIKVQQFEKAQKEMGEITQGAFDKIESMDN